MNLKRVFRIFAGVSAFFALMSLLATRRHDGELWDGTVQ